MLAKAIPCMPCRHAQRRQQQTLFRGAPPSGSSSQPHEPIYHGKVPGKMFIFMRGFAASFSQTPIRHQKGICRFTGCCSAAAYVEHFFFELRAPKGTNVSQGDVSRDGMPRYMPRFWTCVRTVLRAPRTRTCICASELERSCLKLSASEKATQQQSGCPRSAKSIAQSERPEGEGSERA